MAKKSEKVVAAEELSFEQALAALEDIVHALEEGQAGLDESLGKYEEGVKLLRRCQKLLEGAERRIELVSGLDAQGNPITQPYNDQATLEADQQGQHRSQRRSWEGCTDGGRENRRGGRSEVDDGGGVV
jgi:exodeoxyribonuclease VII small subunit